jgi:hypothetical protein
VRSCDKVNYEGVSLFSKVPSWIFRENILSFFSAFDLFKMRGVNREWSEMVRQMWHKTFKREMFE